MSVFKQNSLLNNPQKLICHKIDKGLYSLILADTYCCREIMFSRFMLYIIIS